MRFEWRKKRDKGWVGLNIRKGKKEGKKTNDLFSDILNKALKLSTPNVFFFVLIYFSLLQAEKYLQLLCFFFLLLL